MPKLPTLVDPNGVEWEPGSAIEVTNLIAAGYRVKGADEPATDAPRPTVQRTPAQ